MAHLLAAQVAQVQFPPTAKAKNCNTQMCFFLPLGIGLLVKNGARYEKSRNLASPFSKKLLLATTSMGKHRISTGMIKNSTTTEIPFTLDSKLLNLNRTA